MSEGSDFTWYVDTKGNPDSNKVMANLQLGSSEEWTCYDQECEDGYSRPLWECRNHEALSRAERTLNAERLPFAIYCKEGRYGKIRFITFKNARPPRLSSGRSHQKTSQATPK